MHDAASALADGAWRRRGCLVMCGAHPDRVQQARRSAGVEPLPKCNVAESVGGNAAHARNGADWASAVTRFCGCKRKEGR